MLTDNLKVILEALLFATDEPIPLKRMTEILDSADSRAIRRALAELREQYDAEGHAFSLEEIAGGFQLLTRKDYAPWVVQLSRAAARSKLSQAALETLAIIAYKQPILRADIEAIRGVQVDAILRALMERELIKIVGRHDSLGRPLLYGTARKFLETFGLKSLDELPKIEGGAPGAALAAGSLQQASSKPQPESPLAGPDPAEIPPQPAAPPAPSQEPAPDAGAQPEDTNPGES